MHQKTQLFDNSLIAKGVIKMTGASQTQYFICL